MDFLWTARGPVVSGGKLKTPVTGMEINGLPYCTWEDFQAIRWALQQSHQMGRKAAKIYCGMHGNETATQNRNNSEAAAYTTQTEWNENTRDNQEEQSGWTTMESKKQSKKRKGMKTTGPSS